ncbi:hypothetical protein VCRA2120E126_800001 [Vibrio crassostreae]|nr:hypothetical protein VCRA2120E126_800001 [Vibrio crassostreae]
MNIRDMRKFFHIRALHSNTISQQPFNCWPAYLHTQVII